MAEKKKILVVDDSALMRMVLCDIISTDERFRVKDRAVNGLEAFDYLSRNKYDAVVLDVNMPKMNGVELLRELKAHKIPARVLMASTDTTEGAKITLDCLELGAIDFVHKPEVAVDANANDFRELFLQTLQAVTLSKYPTYEAEAPEPDHETVEKMLQLVQKHSGEVEDNQIVAVACSTGGPKALQAFIPKLPKNLKAPVLIVQHMPVGFTKSLAERLDSLSELKVKEAQEGDQILPGNVYISQGGKHMKVITSAGRNTIHYTDEPSREGVKPCANYMYESLEESSYSKIQCVVLTGMGADGTKGIVSLHNKKKIYVIAQEESTCAVYGMPKSIVNSGLVNRIVGLEQVAQEIIMNVGVK